MADSFTDPPFSSTGCMQWVARAFEEGPLRFLLMHVTLDPLEWLEAAPGCRVLASVRCVLRGGTVYGVSVQGPRDALAGACCVLAGVLPSHGYDESFFSAVDREIAGALQGAGYDKVRASLERNAALYPRPVVAAAQVDRLMLAMVNRRRTACGKEALPLLPDALCAAPGDSEGEPAVAAYEAVLDAQARIYQRGGKTVCGHAVDRLAVYNFIAGRAGKSRFRAQALRALPWLLPLLAAPERGRPPWEVLAIRRAIDECAPLHDAVARTFDVPREVIRWLGCRRLPANWQFA